jgi:hypothetical protein
VCRCRLRSAFNVMNFNPSTHKKKNFLLRIKGVRQYYRITGMLLLLLTGLTCAGYSQNKETEENEGPFPGYINVAVDQIDSFYVVVNNDFSNVYRFASGDSLALEEGNYRITLAKAYFRDVNFRVSIREGEMRHLRANMNALANLPETKKRSSYPRIHWGAGTVVVSDHDSDIYVDGEYSGTGLAVVHHGERFTMESRNPAGDVRSRTFSHTEASFEVFELYHRPDRNRARQWAILPGAPQLYKNQYLKGVLIASGFSIVTGLAVHNESRFRSYNRDYKDIQTLYSRETDPGRAIQLGNEAEGLFDQAKSYSTRRNYLLLSAAIIYAYGILDGISSPPGGFRNNNLTIDPYLDFEESSVQVGISVKRHIP